MEAKINEESIRRRAFEIYQTRGGIDGNPESDWLAAQNQLRAESADGFGSSEAQDRSEGSTQSDNTANDPQPHVKPEANPAVKRSAPGTTKPTERVAQARR